MVQVLLNHRHQNLEVLEDQVVLALLNHHHLDLEVQEVQEVLIHHLDLISK